MKRKPPPDPRLGRPGARKGRGSKEDSVSKEDSELFRRLAGPVRPLAPADDEIDGLDGLDDRAGGSATEAGSAPCAAPGPAESGRAGPASRAASASRKAVWLRPEAHATGARPTGSEVRHADSRTTRVDDHHGRAKPGVRRKEWTRLRRGLVRPQADIDLHGLTLDGALAALDRFVAESGTKDMRCVRVIHGKGFGSPCGEARLRPAVIRWLDDAERVLAYCPAVPSDGGTGATYALLKARARGTADER